jgi:hypothetical protein
MVTTFSRVLLLVGVAAACVAVFAGAARAADLRLFPNVIGWNQFYNTTVDKGPDVFTCMTYWEHSIDNVFYRWANDDMYPSMYRVHSASSGDPHGIWFHMLLINPNKSVVKYPPQAWPLGATWEVFINQNFPADSTPVSIETWFGVYGGCGTKSIGLLSPLL